MENLSCIKVKLAFFFVLTFLMFVFYWYLITCFSTVYQNTQMKKHFIKFALLLSLLLSVSCKNVFENEIPDSTDDANNQEQIAHIAVALGLG